MKSLRIIKLKPNPTGRDLGPYAAPNQLAAEWVDLQNNGTESFALSQISLCHIAYQANCSSGKYEIVQTFQWSLGVDEIIRVHSGKAMPVFLMKDEDSAGAHHHGFTNKGFIWNNNCGDTAGLWDGQKYIDKASYDPYPKEGKILVRLGDKLV